MRNPKWWIGGWVALMACGTAPAGSEQDDVSDDEGFAEDDIIDDDVRDADADGDGFTTDDDCNDSVATIHPDAPEVCNGYDDDCDGLIDDEDPGASLPKWFADEDGDGSGNPSVRLNACEPGPGWTQRPGDCDDSDPNRFYARLEVGALCSDGKDNDCDGLVDGADSGCPETACDDGIDNDEDGLLDCEDADCAGATGCDELCFDTVDNDNDGAIDFDDDDCIDVAWSSRFELGVTGGVTSRSVSGVQQWCVNRDDVTLKGAMYHNTGLAQSSIPFSRTSPEGDSCEGKIGRKEFSRAWAVRFNSGGVYSTTREESFEYGRVLTGSDACVSDINELFPRELNVGSGSQLGSFGRPSWYVFGGSVPHIIGPRSSEEVFTAGPCELTFVERWHSYTFTTGFFGSKTHHVP